MSRDFYLAYIGTINELELDFLTYVHGAGQEIVAKNYGTVAKSSTFLSNQAEGEILIEGSTSVATLMEQLAEAHCIFNISGCLLFIWFVKPYAALIQYISPKGPEIEVISRQIANAHTVFNITMTVIWIPC